MADQSYGSGGLVGDITAGLVSGEGVAGAARLATLSSHSGICATVLSEMALVSIGIATFEFSTDVRDQSSPSSTTLYLPFLVAIRLPPIYGVACGAPHLKCASGHKRFSSHNLLLVSQLDVVPGQSRLAAFSSACVLCATETVNFQSNIHK